VEVNPTNKVFEAICRRNCGVGLLCVRRNISKLAASVSNSSIPSRSDVRGEQVVVQEEKVVVENEKKWVSDVL
jgi:hypothetical protein